jgi:peptidoglycan/LPS O-acetylase OafA/YrhL
LFIERSAQKGSAQYLKDKLATLAWPYLVWTFLQGGAAYALSRYTNAPPPTFTELALGLFYEPYAHLWFLYVLFLYALLFLFLYRVRVGHWGLLLIALGMYTANLYVENWRELLLSWLEKRFGIAVDIPGLGELHPILHFLVFLAVGVLLSRLLVQRLPDVPAVALALVLLCAALMLVGGVVADWDKQFGSDLLLALVGTAGTLAAAVLAARVAWLGWVRRLGELSMPIYLAHILAGSGARIVLTKFLHVEDLWIQLVAGMAAGVLLPIGLELVSRRTRTHWLFSLR